MNDLGTYEEMLEALSGDEGLLGHISVDYWLKYYIKGKDTAIAFNELRMFQLGWIEAMKYYQVNSNV